MEAIAFDFLKVLIEILNFSQMPNNLIKIMIILIPKKVINMS
jgi:hypothetical protein